MRARSAIDADRQRSPGVGQLLPVEWRALDEGDASSPSSPSGRCATRLTSLRIAALLKSSLMGSTS